MKWKGSLILEASYIFPLCLIFIFVLMIFAYYKHDSIVFRSSARVYLMRKVSEREKGEFKEEREGILHYLSILEVKEEKEKNAGKLSARVNFAIMPEFLRIDKKMKNGEFKTEYKAYRPQDKARKLSVLLGGI